MLIEKPLREATSDSNGSTLVRAQTLAVLEGLDPNRKGILLEFLYESNLINKDKPFISLAGANLFKANLKATVLSDAHLRVTNLSEADLRATSLKWADLRGAFLIGANMERTDLMMADLRGANLSGAINLTEKQIALAFGDTSTTLPDYLESERPTDWPKSSSEGGEE